MVAKLTLADRWAGRTPEGALARAQELLAEEQTDRAFRLFTTAAEAGLVAAQREIGRIYLQGATGVRALPEAERWLTRAAEAGDTISQLELARMFAGGYHPPKDNKPSLFANQALGTTVEAAPDFQTALIWATKAGEAGNIEAAALLGYLYLMASPALQDEEKALYWYSKAADGGLAQGYLGKGIITLAHAHTDEPTFEGVALLRQAVEAGLPAAHHYMAIICERGIGVLPDLAQAAEHYLVAAEAGIRDAQAKYGYMLFTGHGIKQNKTEGETWLRRAGLAGDPEAALIIANHYVRADEGNDPNYTEAAAWFTIATEHGRPDAARALGLLYLTGAGVGRDADEAAKWFRIAADQGNAKAQADFASLVLQGRLNDRITAPAPVHEWFEAAAATGDLVGAYNYAVCLAQGVSVDRDDAKAAHWFRVAAEGVLNAQYQLARFLLEGRGVAQDLVEGREWMRRAATLNMQEALMDYGALLLQGIGGERDDAQARDIFTRAAELHGTPNAMFALGALYGGGHQIETDRETSLSWYRRAADKGHARAAIMLGKYLRYGIATAVDLDAARNWFTFAATNGLADEANAELAALDLSPAPTTPEEAA